MSKCERRLREMEREAAAVTELLDRGEDVHAVYRAFINAVQYVRSECEPGRYDDD